MRDVICEEHTIKPQAAQELAERLALFEKARPVNAFSPSFDYRNRHFLKINSLSLPEKRALHTYIDIAKNAVLATSGIPKDALERFTEHKTDVLLLRNCLPEETLKRAVQSQEKTQYVRPFNIVGNVAEAAAIGLHASIKPLHYKTSLYVIGALHDKKRGLHNDYPSGDPIVVLGIDASPSTPVETVFCYTSEREKQQKNAQIETLQPRFAVAPGDTLFFHEHHYYDAKDNTTRTLHHGVTGGDDDKRYLVRVQAVGNRPVISDEEAQIYQKAVTTQEFMNTFQER